MSEPGDYADTTYLFADGTWMARSTVGWPGAVRGSFHETLVAQLNEGRDAPRNYAEARMGGVTAVLKAYAEGKYSSWQARDEFSYGALELPWTGAELGDWVR